MKITGALVLLASGSSAFQPLASKGNSRVSPVFSYLSSLGQVAPLGSTPQNNDIATRGGDVSISKNDFFARRADEDRTVSPFEQITITPWESQSVLAMPGQLRPVVQRCPNEIHDSLSVSPLTNNSDDLKTVSTSSSVEAPSKVKRFALESPLLVSTWEAI